MSETTMSAGPPPRRSVLARVVSAIAILGSLYHLYVAGFGAESEMSLRSIHWTLISVLVFMLFPLSKTGNRLARIVDWVFLLAALGTGLYVLFRYPDVAENAGFIETRDVVIGIIAVVVVLEASRRVVGLALSILASVFLAYSAFGQYLPGILGHKGFTANWIISVLYMGTDGIYGMPIGVSASYIVLFVLFGSFLQVSGGGRLFNDLAFALVGRRFGGPAKAAVVASGLMGMMSGSAAANVATVGTFTIPLMKRSGYSANSAAAVEACASTGGQFMPPVMGAAAFIIAQTLGISYGKVALSAAISAVLYYVYLYLNVDIVARKTHIERLRPEEIPSLKTTLKERGHLAAPLLVLIVMMMLGYSPGKAVLWSIVLLVAAAQTRKLTRINLAGLMKALEEGITGTIPIAAACAAAGIIGGVITASGLGLSFSSILISFAGKSTIALLLLTMTASIILGMGLPTTACYIILAVLTAPALTKMGISPLPAHFFIFFFGCISTITPPVALAAYAAAGIAKTNPMKAGYTAFMYGFIAFVIPFIGVYYPGLLLEGDLKSTVVATGFTLMLMAALVYAFQGHGLLRPLTILERLLFAAAAVLLFFQASWVGLAGLVLFVALMVLERSRLHVSPSASVS